jgi:hypothetical protein
MRVPLIASCTFGNPHNYQKSSIATFIYVLVGHKINFLEVMLSGSTKSCNMSDNVDLLIVNNLLQIRKLIE